MFFHVGPGTKESLSFFKTDPTLTLVFGTFGLQMNTEMSQKNGSFWTSVKSLNSVNLT